MPNSPKPKYKSYQRITIVMAIITIFILGVSIFYGIIGTRKIEEVKADNSNLVSKLPVSATIEDFEDIRFEYSIIGTKGNIKYYNNFLVNINGKKIILETSDPKNINIGKVVNITKDLSFAGSGKRDEIKNNALINITKNKLKLLEGENESIPILSHYTDNDKWRDESNIWLTLGISTIITAYYYHGYRKSYREHQQEQMVINYQKEEKERLIPNPLTTPSPKIQ